MRKRLISMLTGVSALLAVALPATAHSSPNAGTYARSSAYMMSPPGVPVQYNAVIKLRHVLTGHALHSHDLRYTHPGTSGQQQVTAFAGYDDNDLWRVKAAHGQPARLGDVRSGEVIRLEHVLTRRNLHSHLNFPSPVTGQQEVTAFGRLGIGDANDDWRLEVLSGGRTWTTGGWVRLVHVLSNHTLHSHAGWSHPQWTAGQQEVTGFPGRDDNDFWFVSEVR